MNVSTHRLPPEFLDYYCVTGINESMKTSQSNRLNFSVSFNKHNRNVFYCKHLDGSSGKCSLLWTLKIECVKEPINANVLTKQTDNISFGKQTF